MTKMVYIMPSRPPILLPVVQRTLQNLGERIRLARLRRKYTATMVAQRAGISRVTLGAIERGEPQVTLGSYASVLFSLGVHVDLNAIADEDALGRKLQDAELLPRQRAPRRSE